ncbi:uncharacterized protein LOC127872799 [Dreissena polymorpha]|uniref:B box-type domain-containing protein n=1 Tax=Dreissena polymorpha TaxID=45954 RepID=A0A9D4QUX7_DREPO|nr:uncharacterized protein LOC127872799 [Dreissena polymorpha]KAH3844424.1 hypothetical protein DPMN_086682 [Dreissena polymorpha]
MADEHVSPDLTVEEIIYEHPCIECGENGINSEASYFCENCGIQYCRMCFKEHERTVKFHSVLGPTQKDAWGPVRSSEYERCKRHRGNDSDMFCGDHLEVCCSVCVAVSHGSCKDVQRLNKDRRSSTKASSYALPWQRHRDPNSHPLSRRPSRYTVGADHVFTLTDRQWYSAWVNTDEKDSEISGMCQLHDGTIVIVDSENCKVKQLDNYNNYAVVAHCSLPERPRDVCVISDTEIAVTVLSFNEANMVHRDSIHFITLNEGVMVPGRVMNLPHGCRDIAHQQDFLYLASMDTIYKYTLEGKLVKKIYHDKSGGEGSIERMVMSGDGHRLYVCDKATNQLHTLSIEGKCLASFSDPDLTLPTGVCVARMSGHVFVCGQWSHTIVQVSKDGKHKLSTLAYEADGVEFPQTLLYDVHHTALVVGHWECDHVLVLRLK